MVARRISGVSDGFADFFFFRIGVSEPDWPFSAGAFFFFFPFSAASLALGFFGFGRVVASGVSFGVGDASESFVDDFLLFDFGVASGVSCGFAEASASSVADFPDFVFFFPDADGDGESEVGDALALAWPFPEVVFFFLPGDAFAFGEGVGVFSLAGESTALAFRIGLSSSVGCASETKTEMSALSANNVVNQTRERTTERSVTDCVVRSTRESFRSQTIKRITPVVQPLLPLRFCGGVPVRGEESSSTCRRAGEISR